MAFVASVKEFSISRVSDSMAAVAGLDSDPSGCMDAGVAARVVVVVVVMVASDEWMSVGTPNGGNVTFNFNGTLLSSGNNFSPSFRQNCSDELVDNFRVFFLRLGGAMGPVDIRLSVVFE